MPKMRGLWLEEGELALRSNITRPVPASGEALVRVNLAGICQTDLELVKGYSSFSGVPGHEFAGRVALAPDQPKWEGRRVVGEINCVCGQCRLCRRGLPHHCLRRTVLGIVGRNGAFAEYLVLPIGNLHPIPDSLPDEAAVFTEPLAAAMQILEQLRILPEHSVLLIGAGKLGQLIARVLLMTDCRLRVVARYKSQTALLPHPEISQVGNDKLPEKHFDYVVEATGTTDGLRIAILTVRPAGTIVLKSTYRGPAAVDLSRLVVDEVTLLGSRCGPFPAAIELLEKRLVDPRPLISETSTVDQGLAAFARAGESGVMKVLLQV